MNYEELKKCILTEIEGFLSELTIVSDDMADHPELSGQEFETSNKLVRLLEKYGYRTEYPFAGRETAFRAVYGEKNHKYKIALLIEYDALPELGHACGHCLSASAGILAGIALRPLQDILNADIYIIGTPDEEDDGAKCMMAEQGIFDFYDMAIMVHYYHRNLVMPRFQALAEYFYEFYGKAAHASAAPWEGRNALNGLQLMIHAVDMLRQHTRNDAQFHYVIKEGGVFPNIVPEKAVLQMFIRAGDKAYIEELIRLVDDCADGAATATQTVWEKYPKNQLYYVDLRRNAAGESAVREVFEELRILENAPNDMVFGSSDIGNVSYVCPAFHPCLQITDEAPIHTREFAEIVKSDRAHQAIGDGAAVIGLTVAKIFSNQQTVEEMKSEFQKKF